MKKRLDQYLVELGYSPSRTKAKELIESGLVQLGNSQKVITTPSYKVNDGEPIVLQKNELLKFVSRAGLKLDGALDHLGLSVDGLRAIDVGLSTGGFSDCLLQRGVQEIVGIDVGHDQLAEKLKQEDRLNAFDGINAKAIANYPQLESILKQEFDLLVMDVSFISQTTVLANLILYVKPGGHFLVLVKPQFELSSGRLNKKGIVKDKADYNTVEEKLKTFYNEHGLQVLNYFESSIEGRDGNKEFFIYAQK